MPEPTLLQQARQHMRNANNTRSPRTIYQREVANAVAALITLHEAQHATMSGPAQVPGEPRCKVCGLPESYNVHNGNFSGHRFEPIEPARQPVAWAPGLVATLDASDVIGVEAVPAIDLDELQRLCDTATPGPWDGGSAIVENSDGLTVCEFSDPASDASERDADFICAARDALPKLIAQVRQLQAQVENADALREYADKRCLILADRLKEVEHAR